VSDEQAADGLEIHDPVDDVPGAPASRRGSKWDAVIAQAETNPGRWVPVTKPRTFTASTATWLRERREELVVEVRSDKVYLKWDPDAARELRIEAAAKAGRREAGE
jgi:hypothetical protein